MKEEFKKTAVDSPSIKLARADFEFIKNEFETKTYLFDGSENNLEDDPVDNTVFLEKLNTSMLNLAVDEFAKKFTKAC